MSLSVTTDVFCDRCPRWLCGTQGRLRAEGREARRLAREAGWVHRDGLDLQRSGLSFQRLEPGLLPRQQQVDRVYVVERE